MTRSIAIKALAAATLGLAIAFAPAAFAADDMKKDTMTKDSMSKDKMDKDKMDKDSMSKDRMKKRFDEKRRYEKIKHIRLCRVRLHGLGTSSVGVPIWISGGVMSREANRHLPCRRETDRTCRCHAAVAAGICTVRHRRVGHSSGGRFRTMMADRTCQRRPT